VTVATRVDPVKLAEWAFEHDHWETPAEILRAVFQPRARVAVKACHASSKTFSAADAVLIALLLGGDVITTAPTWVQVKDVLWAAIHRTIASGKIPAAEWGNVNQTEIRLSTGEFAIGLSTDLGVRFQGHHARPGSFLLVIFDEAPGVRPDIYEAVEGISAGGDVRILLLGNPVIAAGRFYDIFATDAPGWQRFTIDALDTPNLRGLSLESLLGLDEPGLALSERPYLVDRAWVRARYEEWGPDHPLWQSRVRGQFPLQADDALLSLGWIEQANLRSHKPQNTAALSAGIDVAGPGEDETVVAIRQGNDAVAMRAWSKSDARDEVIEYLKEFLHRGLKYVAVDSVGNGWFFFCDILAALKPFGVQVMGANVGIPSEVKNERGDRLYANVKAEWYWHLRTRFEEDTIRANGVFDQTTVTQLVGLKYEQPRGVVTIEKKEDARKRGVKSPDRAEAWMLAFAPDDPALARRMHVGTVTKLPQPVSVPVRNGRVARMGRR
jgi:hypothetical protein